MASLTRVLMAVLLTALAAVPAYAAEGLQLVEQKIKAGLIYNFLKYTEWHDQAESAPITVCLYGGDAFEGHLQPMAGRTVNQRVIAIEPIAVSDDWSGCSLIFVHSDQRGAWPTLKESLVRKQIMTVADFEGFAAAGGMIEFTRVDNRIGVKINTKAIDESGLKVQDRLLKLAEASRAGGEP